MATKEFAECLIDVFRGEVAGEAVFEGMLAIAETVEQKYILGSMLQFETEGKAIVRPLLMRFGLSMLEDPESRTGGASGAMGLNGLPWRERFAAMQEVVKTNYLPRYLELATLVSADEDAEVARIATFMGNHERAIVAAAGNIAAGAADPIAPITALLHFPLPRPNPGTR